MGRKEIIAIVGATGAQGGGLARAILKDPESHFGVRAVTRNPDSDKARVLSLLGAELVQADIDDSDSVRRAFDGAYGAYCVTNFWEHFSPEREIAQARNMADAAAATGLEHVIWSTLEDTRRLVPLTDDRMPTLMERYKVPHFDAKGEADDEFRSRGIPTTFLLTSFYWDNFIHLGMGPTADAGGELAISLPMGDQKLPGIAADDIGGCAYGVFMRGQRSIGKTIGIAGEHLTGAEMADAFSRILGRRVRYNSVSPEAYRRFGFPGAEDLGNMFQFKRDFNEEFCRVRDVRMSRTLNPALKTFDEWLEAHRNELAV